MTLIHATNNKLCRFLLHCTMSIMKCFILKTCIFAVVINFKYFKEFNSPRPNPKQENFCEIAAVQSRIYNIYLKMFVKVRQCDFRLSVAIFERKTLTL